MSASKKIPKGYAPNPVQTTEFRDSNQNGVEDRSEGLYRKPSDLVKTSGSASASFSPMDLPNVSITGIKEGEGESLGKKQHKAKINREEKDTPPALAAPKAPKFGWEQYLSEEKAKAGDVHHEGGSKTGGTFSSGPYKGMTPAQMEQAARKQWEGLPDATKATYTDKANGKDLRTQDELKSEKRYTKKLNAAARGESPQKGGKQGQSEGKAPKALAPTSYPSDPEAQRQLGQSRQVALGDRIRAINSQRTMQPVADATQEARAAGIATSKAIAIPEQYRAPGGAAFGYVPTAPAPPTIPGQAVAAAQRSAYQKPTNDRAIQPQLQASQNQALAATFDPRPAQAAPQQVAQAPAYPAETQGMPPMQQAPAMIPPAREAATEGFGFPAMNQANIDPIPWNQASYQQQFGYKQSQAQNQAQLRNQQTVDALTAIPKAGMATARQLYDNSYYAQQRKQQTSQGGVAKHGVKALDRPILASK